MPRFEPTPPCPNMNHRRANAPVGHCPNCGGVVNAALRPRPCVEADHAAGRRAQTTYCVHCGEQLIAGR